MKENNVLILGFNRSDLFEELLDQLNQLEHTRIWVACDGPRNGHTSDIEQIRQIRLSCRRNRIATENCQFLETNHGVRNGVMRGISWFFENVSQGVIIEDDVRINLGYLRLMFRLLESYKESRNVFSISSHSGLSEDTQLTVGSIELVLSPVCRVWGWATWSDRWKTHLCACSGFADLTPYSLWNRFKDKGVSARDSIMVHEAYKHKVTWDYELNFSHRALGVYSICPLYDFSYNKGFRSDATHLGSAANSKGCSNNLSAPSSYRVREATTQECDAILKECHFGYFDKTLIDSIRQLGVLFAYCLRTYGSRVKQAVIKGLR